MGHTDGSVSAQYSHVPDEMRFRLLAGFDRNWYAALDTGSAMSPRS